MTDHEPDDTEIVYVSYTADLDRDALEDFVDEAHPDADHVQVVDRVKTDDLLFRGERPGYVCPECGRGAMSFRTASGGRRIYSHGIDDKCEWQDPEWEPSEYHPDHPSNQTPRWRQALGTVVAYGTPLAVVGAVLHAIPQTTVSMGGETVPFPPDISLATVGVVALAFLFIMFALKHAPGFAGSRYKL